MKKVLFLFTIFAISNTCLAVNPEEKQSSAPLVKNTTSTPGIFSRYAPDETSARIAFGALTIKGATWLALKGADKRQINLPTVPYLRDTGNLIFCSLLGMTAGHYLAKKFMWFHSPERSYIEKNVNTESCDDNIKEEFRRAQLDKFNKNVKQSWKPFIGAGIGGVLALTLGHLSGGFDIKQIVQR